MSEQEKRKIEEALKSLTHFQRVIPEIKQTLYTLLKK